MEPNQQTQNPQPVQPQSIGEIPVKQVVQSTSQQSINKTPSASLRIPDPPSSNKWIKSLVVFLILIILGLSGYILLEKKKNQTTVQNSKISTSPTVVQSSPTPADPTANWKTYANYQLGISFSYPADWQVNE